MIDWNNTTGNTVTAIPTEAYPLILLSIIAEALWFHFGRKERYPWKDVAASTALFILRVPQSVIRIFLIIPLIVYSWTHRLFTIPHDTAAGWAISLLLVEFCYYWGHRLSHEIQWLWASHAPHHSPTKMHFSNAYRLGVTEIFSGTWLFYMPLFWIGVHPVLVGIFAAANNLYQFWLHTEMIKTLGPLEHLVNAPSHHRVHHATNDEYIDKNFGGILLIFDRLFGTFQKEIKTIKIEYGLIGHQDTSNPIKIAFCVWRDIVHEIAHAQGIRDIVRAVARKPGAQAISPSAEIAINKIGASSSKLRAVAEKRKAKLADAELVRSRYGNERATPPTRRP